MIAEPEKTVNPNNVKRVLLIRFGGVGDIVHVTPCIRAIREGLRGVLLTVVVEGRFSDVVKYSPHIDNIIECDHLPERSVPFSTEFARAHELLGRSPGQFDLAIDLQGTVRSAVWMEATGARYRCGRVSTLGEGEVTAAPGELRRGWTVSVPENLRKHAILEYADLLEAIGFPVGNPAPEVFVSKETEERVAAALRERDLPPSDFLMVNPFSRVESKDWPIERWAELIVRLHERYRPPTVVHVGPSAYDRGAELFAHLRNLPGVAQLRLGLAETMCLLRRAALAVTVDTGPMHIAAAWGVKVVALFGPSLPERTAPWGSRHVIIQAKKPADCRAWLRDHSGEFIRAIGVDEVLGAVSKAWEEELTGTDWKTE